MSYDFQFTCKCGKRSLKYNTTTEAAALEAVVSVERWSVTKTGVVCCHVCKPKKAKVTPITAVTGEPRTITLCLPVPPSTNQLWKVYRGKMCKTDVARQYTTDVQKLSGVYPLLTGDLCLELRWYRKDRRGDVTNRIKIVEDALQGVAYLNDSQVTECHIYRYEDKHDPRIEVTVTELKPAAVKKAKGEAA